MNKRFLMLVAALLFAACSNRVTPGPVGPSKRALVQSKYQYVCSVGTEFIPGERIFLGENEDYSATLVTFGGIDPSATLMIATQEMADFPPVGSVLPKEGETRDLSWWGRVELFVANCGGRYFYRVVVHEVVLAPRDEVCAGDLLGPLKPWPFVDKKLVFGQTPARQAIYLVTASGQPIVASIVNGQVEDVIEVDRPLNGKEAVVAVSLSPWTMLVTLRNCSESLYFGVSYK